MLHSEFIVPSFAIENRGAAHRAEGQVSQIARPFSLQNIPFFWAAA
jgi:hypothetical protein